MPVPPLAEQKRITIKLARLLKRARQRPHSAGIPAATDSTIPRRSAGSRLDEVHLSRPVYGSRRWTAVLQREAREVNRKRVVRLLQLMGVEAVYPNGR